MKEIKAYIKVHKLEEVLLELHQITELPGLSVVDVRGFGHRHDERGRDHQMEELVKHAKIEIVCNDDLVDRLVAAIERSAHTGLTGDGRVFVSTIEQSLQIQTGERGERAV